MRPPAGRFAGRTAWAGCGSDAMSTADRDALGAVSISLFHASLQVPVAFLRRVEIGEPPGGIGRRRGLGEGRARIGQARRCEDERRNARWRDARSGRLLGIDHHGRGDRRLGIGERVRAEAGADLVRQRHGGKSEAVVPGAFQLGERGASGLGQAVSADPYRLVVARGVEERDRRAGGAPVAGAERIRLIGLGDEPLRRRLERGLHRRQ